MQRTLIAVFDNHADARSAIEELVAAGFSRPQIRLSEGDPTGGASAIDGDQATEAPPGTGSFADSIKNLLGTLFGTDNSEHVQKYADAVTHGHHVLTLTAGDESDAARAGAIVERFGPVDIDERAAQWSGDALASEAARNGAPRSPVPPMTMPMSQQSVQGGSEQRSGGVKVFTHEAAATLNETEAAIEADDDYYLGHFNRNYAGAGDQYTHHAPAYQYGADMAADAQYRGRPWTEVNSELRRDWEGRNPGAQWDRFEASVRYGWERRRY